MIARAASLVSHSPARADRAPPDVTLLDLVWAASETSAGEQETVATVSDLLASGRARLAGNFRGVPVEAILGRTPFSPPVRV